MKRLNLTILTYFFIYSTPLFAEESSFDFRDGKCTLVKNELTCFLRDHDDRFEFKSSIKISNPSKLVHLGLGNFQDGQNFYMMYGRGKVFKNYKPDEIKILTTKNSRMYYIQLKQDIFFIDSTYSSYHQYHIEMRDEDREIHPQGPIRGFDSSSFDELSMPYARDKNQVYFGALILKDANPKTFNINFQRKWTSNSKNQNCSFVSAQCMYVADDKNVYFQGEKLEEVTSTAFKVKIEKFDFILGIFKSKVFVSGKLLEGIDATKMKVSAYGKIIQDDNTKWCDVGDNHESNWKPKSEIDPKNYPPDC
ncbi:MAG: DKNYY domain-containing protein [Bdellovibrionota bacterium]